MSIRGRKAADESLLLSSACGHTAERAAARAGVSARTVQRLEEQASRRRAKEQQAARPPVLELTLEERRDQILPILPRVLSRGPELEPGYPSTAE